MKQLIILFLILTNLGFQEINAQSGKKEDVVTLKDGTVIYGWILEQEPGKYVKMELVGGSILVVEQGKIEKIIREDSRFKRVSRSYNHKLTPILYRERGVYSYLSPQFSFRNSGDGSRIDVGIHLRLGYRLNRFVALGGGVGIDNYEGGVYMPVYLEMSGDLLRKRITPHYQISAGYGYGASPNWPNNQIDGGFMSFAGIGYKIHTQTKLEWTAVAGYKMQESTERENTFGGGITPGGILRNIRRQGITVQFSIGF